MNIKQYFVDKIKELEEMQKKVEEAEKTIENIHMQIGKDVNDVFEQERIEQSLLYYKTISTFYDEFEKLIQLCKTYLRKDEKHAENVIILYNCLTDTHKQEFLEAFTREERVFITEHVQYLPHYSERVIESALYEFQENIYEQKDL